MHFCKIVSVPLIGAFALCTATALHADDRSMWQKFKDFFSPSPTVVGEGPEYDELRELDKKIGKLEGKYSRERRANNKKYIREEIDKLKLQREKLAKQIEEKEKAAKDAPKSSATVSSSSKTADASAKQAPSKPACAHDTVFVHDTITVHHRIRSRYNYGPRHALCDCLGQARRAASPRGTTRRLRSQCRCRFRYGSR